jgi:signal peptidase II
MEATSLDLIETHPSPTPQASAGRAAAWQGRSRRWLGFGMLAILVAVSDQLLKSWIVANYGTRVGQPNNVVGDWLQIDFIHNGGGLFGLLQGSAPVLAMATVLVAAILIAIEMRSGWRSWLMTITLGLLLGGAVGNLIDRIQYGYVVDFADIGIGTWRWYIFNIADSAVSISILLMILMWFLAPRLLTGEPGATAAKAAPAETGTAAAPSDSAAPADGLEPAGAPDIAGADGSASEPTDAVTGPRAAG